MLETVLGRDAVTRKQSQLRGAAGEPFERGHAVDRRGFADRIHLRVDVERGELSGASMQVGDLLAKLAAYLLDMLRHGTVPPEHTLTDDG